MIDSGIGISQEQQKALFSPFYKIDRSSTKKDDGSGLGLAISKQLAILMKGECGFESKESAGSTFYCIIPFESDDNTRRRFELS